MSREHKRVEEYLGKALDDPTLVGEDFQRFVDARVSEDTDLDFKRGFPDDGATDSDKLPSLVAGMANEVGGVILVGVDEEEAIATAVVGVANEEGPELSLRQRVASVVSPLPRFGVRRVPFTEDPERCVYVVTVPPSVDAPHSVAVNAGLRYPARHGSTRRFMSESEVATRYRQRFRTAQDVASTLGAQHSEALARASGRAWLVLSTRPLAPGVLEMSRKELDATTEWWRKSVPLLCPWPPTNVDYITRSGQRRYFLTDARPGNMPMFGEVVLHVDGSCDILAAIGTRHDDNGDFAIWETSIVFSTIASMQVAGLHAARTGASGDALLTATIVVPGEDGAMASLITARGGFESVVPGSYSIAGTKVSRSVSLEEIDNAAGAVLASYDLASDLLGAFGTPEPLEISRDGEIRPAYIVREDKARVSQWAQNNSVPVAT